MDEKMLHEEALERESDAPEGWEAEEILERNASGVVLSVDVPDDEEASEDAGDDQT